MSGPTYPGGPGYWTSPSPQLSCPRPSTPFDAPQVTGGMLVDQLARLVRSAERAMDILAGYRPEQHRALSEAAMSDVVLEARELQALTAHRDLPGATAPLGGPGTVAARAADRQRDEAARAAGSVDLAERVDVAGRAVGPQAGEGDRDAAAEQHAGVGVLAGEPDAGPGWLRALRGLLEHLEALSAVELEQLTGVVHHDHDTSSAVGSPGAGTPDVSARTVEAATDNPGGSAARDVGGSTRGGREDRPGSPWLGSDPLPHALHLLPLRHDIAATYVRTPPGRARYAAERALDRIDLAIWARPIDFAADHWADTP